MDDRARAVFDEAYELLENPGAAGERKLRELAELIERKHQQGEIVRDAEPVLSAEEREVQFLLSYNGTNAGLRWRSENAKREQANRQADERRTAETRERAAVANQPPLTVTDVEQRIAFHKEALVESIAIVISHERKRVAREIENVRNELDAKGITDQREAAIIDLLASSRQCHAG